MAHRHCSARARRALSPSISAFSARTRSKTPSLGNWHRLRVSCHTRETCRHKAVRLPRRHKLIHHKDTGYYSSDSGTHGFLRTSDGTITTFDPPESGATYALAINGSGAIIGDYFVGGTYQGLPPVASKDRRPSSAAADRRRHCCSETKPISLLGNPFQVIDLDAAAVCHSWHFASGMPTVECIGF